MKLKFKYELELIAFSTGLIGMTAELAGSRLVAPYFGTSIFVWTSIIGTVLASLSVGYYFGGKISENNPSKRKLINILLLATIFSCSILFIEEFLPLIVSVPFDFRAKILLVSILLFSPITISLGMITPYIVRLKINSLEKVGNTVGSLYSISTIGSIVGTFLGGFILISYLGTRMIFICISLFLFLLCIFISLINREKIFTKLFFALLGAGAVMFSSYFSYFDFNTSVLADVDTPYNRWIVYEDKSKENGHPVRLLVNGIGGQQSGIDTVEPQNLLFEYLKKFDYAEVLNPSFKHTLLLGAGGYTYPTHFIATYPDKYMDVVEIDPGLKDLSKSFLSYKDDNHVFVFNEDARIFLNKNKKKYDVIYVDVFSSHNSIPFHLTTVETVKKIKESLTESGIVIINIISSIEGKSSDFLKAEYKTYTSVFPKVVVSQVDPKKPKKDLQNVILIVSVDALSKFDKVSDIIPQPFLESNLPILTDDFAPIEYYTEMF